MKKRTIYITLFLIFIIGVISLIGTFAIDSSITEGNSSKADYLFNITLGDRTNREIVIPSYDSKIVDIKISNPNEFNMSYLLYLEGVNSNISIINISDNESSGVLNSKTNTLIKVFIQNNSGSDITTSIKDIVGFENEKLSVPSNNTSINKGTYYKVIVKSNDNTYGKVKPNIKLSTSKGTVKYTISSNTGYQYKSTTCNGTVSNNILTISNITSNVNCEVVFEPIQVTVNFDMAGGGIETTYTTPGETTYTVPATGTYKLETWGAQGGTTIDGTPGGYGGYSTGNINLNIGSMLYVNVGGAGGRSNAGASQNVAGGYNGGGSTGGQGCCGRSYGSGGGATHIATKSGILSSLSSSLSSIYIVSGGGGGAYYGENVGTYGLQGGSGGGYIGGDGVESTVADNQWCAGLGATQNRGGMVSSNCSQSANVDPGAITGSFGQGGSGNSSTGGGGGYYGGSRSGHIAPAGGGSGYIGNSLLTNKYMYCYNCTTSDVTDTKTYTTTNTSSTPISNYAKSGNGAAKITLVDNANYKVTYNTKYSNLPTPTRAGYAFDGWYTGENGTGTKVTNDTVLKNSNIHTLYAKWVIKNVTVNFDLTGGGIESVYTTPGAITYTVSTTGTYRLETWGAQGGSVTYGGATYRGGYGGYSTGYVSLTKGSVLYLNIGGAGSGGFSSSTYGGGYNGGGSITSSGDSDHYHSSGGGATHIATKSGLLSTLSGNLDSILIVSGGGGGGYRHTLGAEYSSVGGSGGGISGTNATTASSSGRQGLGGSQTAGGKYSGASELSSSIFGSFGKGGSPYQSWGSAGGGGYYGGGASYGTPGDNSNSGGGGGSGYIGNSALTDKYMYCYSCATSSATSTKTYSTTNVSSSPISGYAKSGNGAVKITSFGNIIYTLNYGEKYGNLPTPIKSGATFEGWYTGENGTGTRVTSDTLLTIGENHTLYAYWNQPTEYTDPGSYIYTVSKTGLYKLETWGAQGGSVTYGGATYRGGYGGYSTGNITLTKGDTLYLSVGGVGIGGIATTTYGGGYNGGGDIASASGSDHYHSSGGGATHIATKSGLLQTLSGNLNSIIIISGGGGGGYRHTSGAEYSSVGGSGGGINGTNATTASSSGRQGLGGSQTVGGKYSGASESSSSIFGSFGKGGSPYQSWGSAGGGGYYGGGASYGTPGDNSNSGGGGGSGYIGNSALTDKYMYCYSCATSSATSTKTYSTTNVSSSPVSNYAKSGNGAIRITFIKAS